MRRYHHVSRRITALVAALTLGACDLDLQNPNAPTEDEVLSSIEGVIALAVGMQGQYAGMVEDYVLTSALVTDEWGTRTRSLISYQSLVTGQNFDNSYGVVSAPWAGAYRVIKSANSLLDRAPQLGLGTGLHLGLPETEIWYLTGLYPHYYSPYRAGYGY